MGQNANLRNEVGRTQVTYAKYSKLFVGRCIIQQYHMIGG